MKKSKSMLCLLLSLLMIFSLCSVVSAEEVEANQWEATQKVVVRGQLSANNAGEEVTLMLFKNGEDSVSQSSIGYIGQQTIAEDGSYAFSFKFQGDASQYTARLNMNGKNVDKSITSATVESEIISATVSAKYNFSTVDIAVEMENYFGLADKPYVIIAAAYSEAGALISTEAVQSGVIANGVSSEDAQINIPENAAKVKIFVWSDYARALSYGDLATVSVAGNEPAAVHFIGDSRGMTHGEEDSFPVQGWSYFLDEIFNSNITVYDHSAEGATAASFISSGKWDAVKAELAKGDYVVAALGYEDAMSNTPVIEMETALETLQSDAEAKGAEVIFTTPAPTAGTADENSNLTVYSEAIQSVAEKTHAVCVDVNSLVKKQFSNPELGYQPYDLYYISPAAKTHYTQFKGLSAKAEALLSAGDTAILNERGAKLVADKFAQGLAACTTSLTGYLVDFTDAKAKPVRYREIPQLSYTDSKGSKIKAVLFYGMPYHGSESEVFAYVGVPAGASETNPVPSMVLVHGAAGHAYKDWVELWCSKGYAAISFYWREPSSDYDHKLADGVTPVDYYAGPRRSDISTSVLTGDKADHFMVHATSDISLAYNLINSLPEVKKGETGITGISWGGIISSRGIGEDTRFKFAMPVYGCGNLTLSTGSIHPDSIYDGKYTFANTVKAGMPVFWINGSNDTFFSLHATSQCSYETLSQLCIKNNNGSHSQQHGSGSTGDIPELFAYADYMLKDGTALPTVSKLTMNGRAASFSYESPISITSVKLWYNTTGIVYGNGIGKPGTTAWTSVNITQTADGNITYTVPDDAVGIYFEVKDANGLCRTTDYIESKK